jgi:hypothetical protein
MNLMKNQIIQKKLSLEILKERAAKYFLKPFDKNIMFHGFKMSTFRCRSHVQDINMPKNMFGCPLKLWDFLGFFAFLALN